MADVRADAPEYRGGGGYGETLDCNSALGLLAFLGLINLLRDIVAQITMATTTTTAAPRGLRKRRSYVERPLGPDSELNPYTMVQFIQMGGADGLYEELPHILVPLLSSLSGASDDQKPTECVAAPLCNANSALVTRFGEMGRVLGTLLSNVVAKAFTGGQEDVLKAALEAARSGRQRKSCNELTLRCDGQLPIASWNNNTVW